ncbi:MAG TPA: hypothetical protein VF472_17405 [Burkholderiaceae bacterium]
MLTAKKIAGKTVWARAGERGMVLIMVMIVLVAMMFAGVAMMRSVDTANLIAGNMAFRQGATHQGDFGVEAAIVWLQSQYALNTTTLETNNTAQGYYATVSPGVNSPAAGQTWDSYWSVLDPNPISRPVSTATHSGNVYTLATTSNGYTVSYVIHRMCPTASTSNGCIYSPVSTYSGGNSYKAGNPQNFQLTGASYYRITARIEGPHNTVSYVQTQVAM